MQHPLVNPSLAPYGFVFPRYRERLQYDPPPEFVGCYNRERVIAKLWTKWHRKDALRPLPIETIVHEIMPSTATRFRYTEGDFMFHGLPYFSRDIIALSTVVQWLGTNVGYSFLADTFMYCKDNVRWHPAREFLLKLEKEMERRDMVAFWLHECNKNCVDPRTEKVFFGGEPCFFTSHGISERDRGLVEGLMRWLSTRHGRSFIKAFEEKLEHKREEGKILRRKSSLARRKHFEAEAS